MFLRHICDQTIKVYTLLNVLSPTLLQKRLDPQSSVCAGGQHTFITRDQMPGETVTDFAIQLKKLVSSGQLISLVGNSQPTPCYDCSLLEVY